MTEPLLIARERTLLCDLFRHVADRSTAEGQIELEFRSRNDAIEAEFRQARELVMTCYQTDKAKAEREARQVRQRIVDRYAAEKAAAQKEFKTVRERVTTAYAEHKQQATTEFQESRWTIAAIFEAGKTGAERQFKEVQQRATSAAVRLQGMQQEAKFFLEHWRSPGQRTPPPPAPPPDAHDETGRNVLEAVDQAETYLQQLESLMTPRLVRQKRYRVGFAAAGVLAAAAAGWLTGSVIWALAIVAGFTALGVGLHFWLAALARKHVLGVYMPLVQTVEGGRELCHRYRDEAAANYKRLRKEIRRRRDGDLRQALEKYRKLRVEMKQRRAHDYAAAVDKYRRLRSASKERRDRDLRVLGDKYRKLRTEIKQRHDADLHQVHDRYYRALEESKARHEDDWNRAITAWHEGMANVHAAVTEVNAESDRLFPDWREEGWAAWAAPQTVPPVIRFGKFAVDLSDLPAGLPQDERLQLTVPSRFELPAFLAFPNQCSLLLKASDAGRAPAVQALQAVMMRFLTAVPPSKVRFTIVDPVGLGENFATFMHLADHDELLITNKIWTEMAHVEQRLIDLTAHMEVVIQKYLRNQFQTIEEYNAQAGEVAEPFRILVVANFPANFSIEAARRLVSIASSGARCGVYTLISVDTKQAMPQGFTLKDLEPHCVNLAWKDDRFIWKEPDFARFPLRLEEPPDAELGTRILHEVGARAKEASRVEVPFDFIAPAPERWWTSDSRSGIDVALGRAGATKRQHLRLGQGTSQHVLIAGKTGSGKSTLLHALITNLSLLYAPEEVELYLIDFKKGVEFKTYATEELPHARVVAIESEREFGLSVLQRLDGELRQRGERFRALGVQDLNSYRQANGTTPLPRILLIVDEFQEFFVEDDRIAQEAAQLLDRLVRQGRAFGLHILLGSQTLGGAYTLARSTIDQMAVRIALQCSETDAHLILSDGNSAARLLSRPGEAIYNDANGLVEGNNPFQVVWLPEPRREELLQRVRELDRRRNGNGVPRGQIVFEGNAPADVSKNPLLVHVLQGPAPVEVPKSAQAWLGEAMAIKDPTAAVFRPQTGSNLLVVGQYDESALGLLANALLSLAAQYPAPEEQSATTGVRFYVLDGSPVDSPHAGFFARLASVVPHPVKVAGWRDVGAVVGELAEEVERRQKAPEASPPPVYLFVYGLQRFRDLRRSEDDFSFGGSGSDAPSLPGKFATLLREGAGLGMHTLLWCDSLNNLNRALDRQSLREFELRVLFQMSVNDSSTLIDSPLASKLGMYRAYYFSEEQGRLEKFRPYGVPSEAWLAWVKERLARKPAVVAGTT